MITKIKTLQNPPDNAIKLFILTSLVVKFKEFS